MVGKKQLLTKVFFILLSTFICTSMSFGQKSNIDVTVDLAKTRNIYQNFKKKNNYLYVNSEPTISIDESECTLWLDPTNSLYIIIPFKGKIMNDSIYKLSMEINTNFPDTSLDDIVFFTPAKEKGVETQVTYHQTSRFDFTSKKQKWFTYEFYFIGNNNMKDIRTYFEIKKPTKNIFFAIKNVKIELFINKHDSLNLIKNGDFELNYEIPLMNFYFGNKRSLYFKEIESSFNDCLIDQYGNVKKSNTQILVHEDGYVNPGYHPHLGTPDIKSINNYFTLGNVLPYSGRYYIGLMGSHDPLKGSDKEFNGEYIQFKLQQKMNENSKYKVEFAYMLLPSANYATNTLGIKFTECTYTSNIDKVPFTYAKGDVMISDSLIKPTQTWQLFSYIYTANGSEQYITIGPFIPPSGVKSEILGRKAKNDYERGAYYFIDKVSVIEVKVNK